VNSTQVAAGNEVGNQIGGGNQTPIITVATHTVARFNVQILVGQISVMIPVTVVLGETTPLGNVVDGAGLGQQHTRAVLDQILGNVGGIVQNVVNGSIQQAQGVDSVQQSQIGNVVQQAHGGVNVQLGNATPTILGNVVQQAQGVDKVQQSQIGNVVQQAHGGASVQLGNATPTLLGNVVQQAQGVDNVQQSLIENVVQQAHGGVQQQQLGDATQTLLGNAVQQVQGVNVQVEDATENIHGGGQQHTEAVIDQILGDVVNGGIVQNVLGGDKVQSPQVGSITELHRNMVQQTQGVDSGTPQVQIEFPGSNGIVGADDVSFFIRLLNVMKHNNFRLNS
jgi:hypothetical protein